MYYYKLTFILMSNLIIIEEMLNKTIDPIIYDKLL